MRPRIDAEIPIAATEPKARGGTIPRLREQSRLDWSGAAVLRYGFFSFSIVTFVGTG
jgi:hypothetical protein